MADWLTADEALARLGVRPQTLYAYVSRGRVRAEPDPAEPRRSRYRASDVAALAERKARGRKAADVAERRHRLGRAGAGLGDHHGARRAALLSRPRRGAAGRHRDPGGGGAAAARRRSACRRTKPLLAPPGPTATARAFAAFAARAAVDPPAQGRATRRAGGRGGAAARPDGRRRRRGRKARPARRRGRAIHERLGRAWRAPRDGWDAIRRALVLLADHELNASTFAARVAASTGASLARGRAGRPRGAVRARCTAAWRRGSRRFVGEARRAATGARRRRARVARACRPGFGHPLYPDGDPRAAALLAAFDVPPALRGAARRGRGRDRRARQRRLRAHRLRRRCSCRPRRRSRSSPSPAPPAGWPTPWSRWRPAR